MAQAGPDPSGAARQDAAKAVGVEGGAENLIDLVLQRVRDFVTAQVDTRCDPVATLSMGD
jgi:hypothetical protein